MSTAAPPRSHAATEPHLLPRELAVDAAGATHVGRVRAVDQDRVLVTPRVLAVADGMGGANAGEVASRVAIEMVRGIAGVLDPGAALPGALGSANAAVHALAAASPDLRGMGTTLSAVALGEDGVTVAHVGDSRVYLLRSGRLARLTRDHNAAAQLREHDRGGGVSGLATSPLASVLLRAVGAREEVSVDVARHEARSGDRWLLCTDGLVKHLDDDEIAGILETAATAREAVAALVDATLASGATDNVGVAVLTIP